MKVHRSPLKFPRPHLGERGWVRGTFGRVGQPDQFWPPDRLSRLGDPGQHRLLRLRDDRGPREGLVQPRPEVSAGEEGELEQGEELVFEEKADGDLELLAQSPGSESETEEDADSRRPMPEPANSSGSTRSARASSATR